MNIAPEDASQAMPVPGSRTRPNLDLGIGSRRGGTTLSSLEDMMDEWEDRRMVAAGHRRTADGGRVPSACDERPCREDWIHADTAASSTWRSAAVLELRSATSAEVPGRGEASGTISAGPEQGS